jgi:hypothetical protein
VIVRKGKLGEGPANLLGARCRLVGLTTAASSEASIVFVTLRGLDSCPFSLWAVVGTPSPGSSLASFLARVPWTGACGVIVRKGKLGEGPANLLATRDLQQTNKPASETEAHGGSDVF